MANKMDLEGAEKNLAIFRQRFPKIPVVEISAMEGDGIDRLITEIADMLDHADE